MEAGPRDGIKIRKKKKSGCLGLSLERPRGGIKMKKESANQKRKERQKGAGRREEKEKGRAREPVVSAGGMARTGGLGSIRVGDENGAWRRRVAESPAKWEGNGDGMGNG